MDNAECSAPLSGLCSCRSGFFATPTGHCAGGMAFVVVVVVVVEMAVCLKYVSQLSFRLLRHPH